MACENCHCETRPPSNWRKWGRALFWMLLAGLVAWSHTGCFYSFSGASVPEDVQTFSVDLFQNTSPLVSPAAAQELTEAVRNKFQTQSRLRLVNSGGDIHVTGAIVDYYVQPANIVAGNTAAENRLYMRVKITVESSKHPEDNLDKVFEQFANYPANVSLTSVESALLADLNDRISQDIFNQALSDW